MSQAIVVEMHSKAGCGFCDAVRSFLTSHGIQFTEIKHDDDLERQAFYDSLGLIDDPGQPPARTMPQLVIVDPLDGDRLRIGGAAETMRSGIASILMM